MNRIETRETWDTRFAFILAAIGSAIGLGNIWRFPYICFKYGGGAFLIPYLVALFTIGIPVMIMELGLGHKMRAGAPGALAKIGKGKEWLGWLALLVASMISFYYVVIMGWCFNFLKDSFSLGWGEDTKSYFFGEFLQLTSGPEEIGSLRMVIVIGLVLSWIWIAGSIWKGAKTVGKVVYVTVLVPWLILLLFLLRGVTLPGAVKGLTYYLTPNFAALKNLEVWTAAYSQVFFSISVGFGIMIAYSSFLPRKSDIVNNAFIICLADAATAFVGGLVVFSTLGYYSHVSGLPVPEVVASGPSLAFITYPTIINLFPFANKLFGVLFFLMLLTLGIDSAFSLVEAASVGIMDKWKVSRVKVILGFVVAGILIGLFYATGSGLFWLDIVDHFMNFGLIVVVFLECVIIGYMYNLSEIREYVNKLSELKVGKWWDVLIKIVGPVVLVVLIFTELRARVVSPYGDYPRWSEMLGGWVFVVLLPLIAVILMKTKGKRTVLWLIAALFGVSVGVYLCILLNRDFSFPFSAQAILVLVTALFLGGIGYCVAVAYRKSRIYE